MSDPMQRAIAKIVDAARYKPADISQDMYAIELAADAMRDVAATIAREAVEAHADKQQSLARALADFPPLVTRGDSPVARALDEERDLAMGRELARLRAELERATGELVAAVQRAESAELGCEIAYRREPTQAEGDAHEHRHDQSMGPSYGIRECHVPMGDHHGHRCACGKWVWGGPTVCQRCVDADAVRTAVARAEAAEAQVAAWESQRANAMWCAQYVRDKHGPEYKDPRGASSLLAFLDDHGRAPTPTDEPRGEGGTMRGMTELPIDRRSNAEARARGDIAGERLHMGDLRPAPAAADEPGLLPCPFCGHKGLTVVTVATPKGHECDAVECSMCEARGGLMLSKSAARLHWNSRAALAGKAGAK